MFRVERSRFRRRHFACHRLGPARTISAGTAHQVDMDVIVVSGVIAGREHCTEIVAGGEMHVAQEALFLRRAVPSLLHRNAPSVGKCEGSYVDGIPESMFGDARATR